MARYSRFVLKVPLNNNKPTKPSRSAIGLQCGRVRFRGRRRLAGRLGSDVRQRRRRRRTGGEDATPGPTVWLTTNRLIEQISRTHTSTSRRPGHETPVLRPPGLASRPQASHPRHAILPLQWLTADFSALRFPVLSDGVVSLASADAYRYTEKGRRQVTGG